MMATLYKRATPEQARMLRIIEGAVRNAAHHHGLTLPPRFHRSVAKRAVGTLTADQPAKVLAPEVKPSGVTNGAGVTQTTTAPDCCGRLDRGSPLP